MSQREKRAAGRGQPSGPGALYLERQGLKRFAGAKAAPRQPKD